MIFAARREVELDRVERLGDGFFSADFFTARAELVRPLRAAVLLGLARDVVDLEERHGTARHVELLVTARRHDVRERRLHRLARVLVRADPRLAGLFSEEPLLCELVAE